MASNMFKRIEFPVMTERELAALVLLLSMYTFAQQQPTPNNGPYIL